MGDKTYRGKEIDVTFDLRRCIHVAECGKRLQQVFDTAKRPWAQPDNAEADTVAAVIEQCPSGALKYRRHNGQAEEPDDQNTVVITASGEYRVRGEVKLTKIDGELIAEESRFTLCRCGESANKPYCDNSHRKARFVADSSVHDNSAETATFEPTGPLTIVMAPGPLLLQGHFEIQDQTGTQIFRGDKTALCRCGDSANKPFCDGTHKSNGFYDKNGL